MAPPLPALMEELVEEILLRFPPAEPVFLFRATLVCKDWCRLISSKRFRFRFRKHHRTAPMLGFICNLTTAANIYDTGDTSFVPTTSFTLPNAVNPSWRRTVDALHGLVLFVDVDKKETMAELADLLVWNSMTGEARKLPVLPMCTHIWSAALTSCSCSCTAPGCDLIDCGNGNGTFQVVVVATETFGRFTATYVYSSKQGAWSYPTIYAPIQDLYNSCMRGPAARVENAIFFFDMRNKEILEYGREEKQVMAIISLPQECKDWQVALVTTEDGTLGFTTVWEYKLYLWLREADDEKGGTRWSQRTVIELDKLLPNHALSDSPRVLNIVNGLGVTFIHTPYGPFSIDLKSGRVTNLFEGSNDRYISHDVVLYRIFLHPGQ